MVTLQDIQQLSIPEQILLVEDVWDHIARTVATLECPAWHKTELDQRWERYLQEPNQTVSWQDIQADLRRIKSA